MTDRPTKIADEQQTMGLLLRLRAGSDEAATLFSQLYREPLLRYCWGYLHNVHEAEDAFQEVTYKVLTTKTLPDRFRPWVYRVARNHCLNVIRKRARRQGHTVQEANSEVADMITGHLTRMVNNEVRQRVTELVAALPEAHQEVLRLRYVEELSRAEIAEILDIEESVVKSRLFEGLKKLRQYVANLDES